MWLEDAGNALARIQFPNARDACIDLLGMVRIVIDEDDVRAADARFEASLNTAERGKSLAQQFTVHTQAQGDGSGCDGVPPERKKARQPFGQRALVGCGYLRSAIFASGHP